MEIISSEGLLLIGFFLFASPEGISLGVCAKKLQERFPSAKVAAVATLYNQIRVLQIEGLVEEMPGKKSPGRGRQPRLYRPTEKGMAQTRHQFVLFAEMLRACVERPSGFPTKDAP